jgi:hypothetical protein
VGKFKPDSDIKILILKGIMELKDFVKATITGIISAVNELNEELKETAVVDPHRARFAGDGVNRMIYEDPDTCKSGSLIHEIEFNLTVSEMNRTDGKVGVAIKVIDAGISNKTGTESQNTVKFSIPVVYSLDLKK